MKNKIRLLTVSLFFATAIFGQTIKKIDGTTITASSLQLKIKYLMKVANVSGVAVAVFNNNKPVFSKTFGLADVPQKKALKPTSVMYACSFAKVVFTYIVMQLVQEKKLDLDKPLADYLPGSLVDYKIKGYKRGYHDLKNDDRYKKITGRMCLNHTTGFPNWRWFEPDDKLKIKFEPGSRYSYSGEGIYLLQFIITQITGKDYETLSQERVFKPFNMTNTSQVWQKRFDSAICYGHNAKGERYDLEKWDEANAGGSMSTTFTDYIKFYTGLIQGRGLTKESFAEMIRPQVRIRSIQQFGPNAWRDSTSNDSTELSYGLGVGVLKTRYDNAFFKEGHDDGWGHYSICFPGKGIAIIIMTNNDNGESIFKELLATAIGDTFTPWLWENYIPYNQSN